MSKPCMRRAAALLCALLVGLCGPLCALAEAIDYADGELEAAQAALFRLGFYEGDCATEAEARTGKLNRATLAALGRYLAQVWKVTDHMYMTRNEYDVLLAIPVPEATPALTPEPTPTASPEPTPAVPSAAAYRGGYMAFASSTYVLKYNTEYRVDASMVVDGDLSTAWNEGASGVGAGEWIELTPVTERSLLYTGFRIANGFQNHAYHKGDRWPLNNRVRTLSVTVDGQRVGQFDIDDISDGYQTIWFDTPVVGRTIRFTIESAYKGDSFADTCISELQPQ